MKSLITLVNVLSALPILAYPLALFMGLTALDSPAAGKSVLAWLIVGTFWGYPAFIVAFIVLSRIYDSPLLALAALLPIPLLVSLIFFGGGFAAKSGFDTASRDFTCGPNSFLSLSVEEGQEGQPRIFVYSFEKKNILSYKREFIATIYGGTWLAKYTWKGADLRNERLFTKCKNQEGKSLVEIFTPISEERERELQMSK